MITFFEFFGTLCSLGATMIFFMVRIEHRLTKIEIKLDDHLINDRDREKPRNPPL